MFFPDHLGWIYTRIMEPATLHGLLDELGFINKESSVSDVLKAGSNALKGAGSKATDLALKGAIKAHRIPGAPTVIRHVLDPANTSDLAQSLMNASRLLGG